MNQSNLSFDSLVFVFLLAAMLSAIMLMVVKHVNIHYLFGRFAVNLRAKCQLDSQLYHEFQRVDVVCGGIHRYIDYVYLSRSGIFVVNTPNQQGRIWGETGSRHWQQKFYKSSSHFPNPLMENQLYILALSEKLGLSTRCFFSVVVFANSRFQTIMPDNVLDVADFADYVAQYDEVLFDEEEVAQIKAVLDANEFDVVFEQPKFSPMG